MLAGPRSIVLQALSIMQEIGPPNGLIVNFHKCEVFGKHDVSPFPPEMKRSAHPNIVILGIPIGDRAFCSSFILEKHEEAKALLLKLEKVSAVDPHVAFSLLHVRQCAGFCKLAHLAHGTPPSLAISALEAFDHLLQVHGTRHLQSGLATGGAQLRQGWPGHALPESAFPSSIHCLSELLWCWSIVPGTPYPCSRVV